MNRNPDIDEKSKQLEEFHVSHGSGTLTTNQGVGVENDQEVLKAGSRGPALLEDFIFREKITHFDHERIPERIVHARGFGAHGYFQVYQNMSALTKAAFLCDPSVKTPVFARFSTVAGFRGSPDTVRDIRGFAVKFYTEEGNFDLVGNNMPVFFIQDAIKFPDLIHALKPEPHNEIPQAQSAHDTFWDFVSSNHESAHNLMWLMSDRAIPKSFRTMEGFGIHTFKLLNAKGQYKFVKFHWKPLLGVHSLVWDEAQKIAGKDPDFNRRDLWEAIQNKNFAEWEFGVQVLDPKDEHKFDFDILDCSKLWPEEVIPVQKIGKMVLDRNTTNYFAETEQVAFCPANLVPGVEFSNDPMLQGRVFSYLDTQISRLGGPNFHEIPINRPLVKVNNNQRDGMHRMSIDEGGSTYFRNAIQGGQPHLAAPGESAYTRQNEFVEGNVTRTRAEKFMDFYSQATLFWNSMSAPEKKHIVAAFRFELGKVKNKAVRQAAVDMINHVDGDLATQIAMGIGAVPPAKPYVSKNKTTSPALSMANTAVSPKTKKVAILIEKGFCRVEFDQLTQALTAAGAAFDVVSCKLGPVEALDKTSVESGETFATAASVTYDGIYLPGGIDSVSALKANGDALHFVRETYKHFKPIGATEDGCDLLTAAQIQNLEVSEGGKLTDCCGVVSLKKGKSWKPFAEAFIKALAAGRFWDRGENAESTPA